MSERRDLLVEIGTEELPSSELKALMDGFERTLLAGLRAAHLAWADTAEAFASPRRLAVRVPGLAVAQPSEAVEHRGPPVAAAFDGDGAPTKAAAGFARRHGVAVDDLERRSAGKAEYLFHVEQRTGRPTAELLPGLVATALAELPAKKRMRWALPGVRFPRPVHWAVLLFGDAVVDCELLGVRSGRATRGHRFHHPEPIELARPADYEPRLLDEGWVIAGFAARAATIREQVVVAAREAGGEADLDPALLDEVTGLVEWPVALAGTFDRRFLAVPAEALIAVMKDHQRYFPVHAADGSLLPAFVTVANIASREPEVVRRGNERVIAPRLADAEFFWQQDRKRPLAERRDGLRSMVFQRRLGTLFDRSERGEHLAGALAGQLGADADATRTAAHLAKCDLLTEMVGEFPELQGIMGGYYAAGEGYDDAVACAIADQYRPAFSGDALPRSLEGRTLALADRLDALVGLFAIGRAPTGDKDPFALRRAALGVVRILVEGEADLDLDAALAMAAAGFPPELAAAEACPAVFDFLLERYKVYATDTGFKAEAFEAVRALRPTRPLDFHARLHALRAFGERPEAPALAAANKRIRNILRKADAPAGSVPAAEAFTSAPERELADALDEADSALGPLVAARDYAGALTRLAALAEPLETFFDGVMVLADDAATRARRLALLERARALFLRVADLSQLPG